MKLWGGRFSKEMSRDVKLFSSSLSIDQQLWSFDIKASQAHVQMLLEEKIIPTAEGQKIIEGLKEIFNSMSEGKVQLNPEAEDIHSEIERILAEKIGPIASKMHTARSRNDQVATDLRLYLRHETNELIQELRALQQVILETAEKHLLTVLAGMTHLQHAQPVSLGHHLMAYFWMFQRDIERLQDSLKRVQILPLGSAALAGTTFPLNRHSVKKSLDFLDVSANSMDAVSDRDFALEFLSHGAILAMHFSRWCEEWIIWSTPEFHYVELDDSVTTGSSIMPQKKNPDMAELIRGRTGRLYGALMGALTLTKGLPLTYNRDLQEDKFHIMTATESLRSSTRIMTAMLESAQFFPENMKKALQGDFSNATDVADHLAKKGVPFREAHEISGKIVRHCLENKIYLEDMKHEEFLSFHSSFSPSIVEEVQHLEVMKKRTTEGGTAPEVVLEQIKKAKALITF